MNRFIVVSFGFLALAFYELSGGSAFDPVAARQAAVEARANIDQPVATAQSDTPQADAMQPAQDAPAVTRVSLNLVSFDDVNRPKEVSPTRAILQKTAETKPVETKPRPVAGAILSTTAVFDTTADAEGVLPSIVFSGSRSRASSQDVTADRDVRSVSGTTVNMRGGPGTNFDVITRLNRDAKVEILEDNGSGWVKLRPVAGGPEGWIADFLLTKG